MLQPYLRSVRLRARIALSLVAIAGGVVGCAAPQRSAPATGTTISTDDVLRIGPNVTEPAVVRVDGFRGPEYREVWYRYTAALVDGTVRVTESGALELLDGTLVVHSGRGSRGAPSNSRTDRAAWAAAEPTRSRAEDLLALQIVGQPSSVTTQERALWWYPIVVSDPTQQGTVGTSFIVQRAVDASGAAVSRVFLRPPLARLFADPSRVWLASAWAPAKADASKDLGVAWLLGTDVYAESVRGPQGVETRILPVDDATAKWLAQVEAKATGAGLR